MKGLEGLKYQEIADSVEGVANCNRKICKRETICGNDVKLYRLVRSDLAEIILEVIGGNIDRYSDTVTLATLSSNSYQMDHLKTQIPYVLPAIISTCFAYIISGYLVGYSTMPNAIISIAIGISINIIILYFANLLGNRKLKA